MSMSSHAFAVLEKEKHYTTLFAPYRMSHLRGTNYIYMVYILYIYLLVYITPHSKPLLLNTHLDCLWVIQKHESKTLDCTVAAQCFGTISYYLFYFFLTFFLSTLEDLATVQCCGGKLNEQPSLGD